MIVLFLIGLFHRIQHNLNVGFDHIYVFDNSGAFGNEDGLKKVTDLFGKDKVTRIPWPAKICNNNLARMPDKGERSSQYAADASCRIRYGPDTRWLTFLDTDEYLVPVGNVTSIKELVLKLEKEEDLKIINFYSARSKPKFELLDFLPDGSTMPKNSTTFLETYSCERELPPKTFWMPAEKQLYKPDYVKHHFIHYPTASVQSLMSRQEFRKAGLQWRPRHNEANYGNARFVNELTEATMIHGKAVTIQETGIENRWSRRCKSGCHFGFPWPQNMIDTLEKSAFSKEEHDENGNRYNCFPNKFASRWAEKIREEIDKLSPA